MVFSSVVFLFIFLPWTLIIHYFLDPRYRNFFLLIVSLIFYAWGEGVLTILIITSIFVNYLAGLLIAFFKTRNESLSRLTLAGMVTLNILVLVYYKYFNFLIANLQQIGLFNDLHAESIHLPIGISFYTFHIISYLVDVFRRDVTSQKNPFDLGLYIFLFPQLVAGPIIRYKDISQKIASRFIIGEDFTNGAMRFIRGLSKKMLIANNVAVIADHVFGLPTNEIPGAIAWLGIICYTLQIYFDFSGYSDMALGLGKMMGFNFPENFNYPYKADSIREFWQRWHISLSTWFRDYLYIPLGGNRKGPLITYRNMFIVFFVTGLWHGASWNFIVWGLFHGCFLVMERLFLDRVLRNTPAVARHLYTMLVVMVAWVFFRADTLEYAVQYLGAMFGATTSSNYFAFSFLDIFNICVLVAGVFLSTDIRSRSEGAIVKRLPVAWTFPGNTYLVSRYCGYILLLVFCVAELSQNNYNPFIYFRF